MFTQVRNEMKDFWLCYDVWGISGIVWVCSLRGKSYKVILTRDKTFLSWWERSLPHAQVSRYQWTRCVWKLCKSYATCLRSHYISTQLTPMGDFGCAIQQSLPTTEVLKKYTYIFFFYKIAFSCSCTFPEILTIYTGIIKAVLEASVGPTAY